MERWQKFELECTDFLNQHFGSYAKFTHKGGDDSTISDILVTTNHNSTFYIEVKFSPAQCGQFVLQPDLNSRTFIYSSKNPKPINMPAKQIIDFMNQDFDAFREAGTAGKTIAMSNAKDVFADWIIQSYTEKGVKFFITNNFTILPIERLNDFFDISATYRIKRSGSRNVGKKEIQSVMNYINSNDYLITDTYTNQDRLFIVSPQPLHNRRFILRGTEYMFSQRHSQYELRKLSKTYHANVIFSIKKKENVIGISDSDFIKYLN